MPLATLIHISDLHFGDKFTADETVFRKLLASLPYMQGTCRHSYQAARALSVRINQILDDREAANVPAGVVFTGDLTANGEDGEFTVGTTFLRGAYWVGAGQYVGLSLGVDRDSVKPGDAPCLFTVPGNHDIWKRKQPHIMGAYLRHFPKHLPSLAIETGTKRRIVVFGLDSTQNTQLKHRLARGRVSEHDIDLVVQYLKWARALNSSNVQIVCLHHPLGDPPGKSFDATMKLERREQIAKLLVESGADLVLAGHVHEWFVVEADRANMPAHVVAGTATQLFSERSFCVFDIFEDRIECSLFEYDKDCLQFLPREAHKHTFPIPSSSVGSGTATTLTARERFRIWTDQ